MTQIKEINLVKWNNISNVIETEKKEKTYREKCDYSHYIVRWK